LAEKLMTTSQNLIHDLRQAKLELLDENTLEQFCFSDDSHIVATIGAKDGPVCGPILNYTVADDDAIEITQHDGTMLYRWEQADLRDDILTVECDGISKRYSVTRAPKKARRLP
jgi:hypothetical protein